MAKDKNFDLVILRTPVSGNLLAVAPAYSRLERDDEVELDGCDFAGKVVDIYVNMDDDMLYSFIIKAANEREPLRRVRTKVVRREFHYNDEQEEVTDG